MGIPTLKTKISPAFIGIGAPKAATTWITKLLDCHPGIFLPAIKESHFFGYPYNSEKFLNYLELFRSATANQIAGEYSTDYLATDETPRRIQKHLPDVKLILALRDPAAQVYSNYWHSLRQGFNCHDNSLPSFEEALERHRESLLDSARFGYHLNRWLQHFDRENLHLVFHEKVKSDPDQVAAELWHFLGIAAPAQRSTPSRDSNSRQGVSPRSPRTARIYNFIYFNINSLILRPMASMFGHNAPGKLIEFLRLRTVSEKLFFRSGYPPMTSKQRQLVIDYLIDDICLLEKTLSRDLSSWKKV